jgi:hypothetical protein
MAVRRRALLPLETSWLIRSRNDSFKLLAASKMMMASLLRNSNRPTGHPSRDYPVTGDSNQSTRAYTKLNDHKMKVTIKTGEKVILSGTITISADGKSRTPLTARKMS